MNVIKMQDENEKKELTLFGREPNKYFIERITKGNLEDAYAVNQVFSKNGSYSDLVDHRSYDDDAYAPTDAGIDVVEDCLIELPENHHVIKAIYNQTYSVLENILKMSYEEIKECVINKEQRRDGFYSQDSVYQNPITIAFYAAGYFRDYSENLFDIFKKAAYHSANEIISHNTECLRDLGSFQDIAFNERPEHAIVADLTVAMALASMRTYSKTRKKDVIEFADYLFHKNFLCDCALWPYSRCEPEKALDKFIELRSEGMRMKDELEYYCITEISEKTFEKGLCLEKLLDFIKSISNKFMAKEIEEKVKLLLKQKKKDCQ
ncbi:MAG: hypothetical protein NTZ02_02820 [Candidatus Woesearchaeota archaeon]|nr:hypothetical protein [Candidatus Woesearchaeota archaeon]